MATLSKKELRDSTSILKIASQAPTLKENSEAHFVLSVTTTSNMSANKNHPLPYFNPKYTNGLITLTNIKSPKNHKCSLIG
jgi:hypothetical protein